MSEGEFLTSQIGRFSGLRYRPLAFAKELEVRFERSNEAFRRRRIWFEGLGAIALYVLFSLLRSIGPGDHSRSGLVLRLSLVLPLAVLVNTSMLFRLPAWIQETGIVVVACLAGSLELILSVREPPAMEAYAQFAIVGVLVFTNNLMRLRFNFAVGAAVWAALAEFLFLRNSQAMVGQEKFFGFSLTVILGAVTLMANYSHGREQRLAFLREHRQEAIADELARSNQDLATVAHTDSLTGLANRAGLNAHLTSLWSDLRDNGGMVSAILVDVDHFKSLNDQFGHLYGDKVLVRVARLLAEALRREDDYIARFGGEEFLILLPNTPLPRALLVAERLRGLVELAGLPALSGPDPRLRGRRATVSCGVAAASARTSPNPLELLNEADQALYSAKGAGRNRVHVSMAVGNEDPVRIFSMEQTTALEEFTGHT